MGWLQTLVTILMGAQAAASLSESAAKGARYRREQRKIKRGGITAKEAARELEHRIGGRIVVAEDAQGEKLVVLRQKRGRQIPPDFAGYRVEREQTIHTLE